MKFNLTSIHWKLIIASLLGVSTLAYCAPADWFGLRKPDFELTGQVLDFDTKQPIEGAYVLAVYEKVDLGLAGASRYCVKTKGMVSEKEGRFHFPVEQLDGGSPSTAHAIKPDYFSKTFAEVSDADFKAQNKAAYSNRHAYLKKQDLTKYDACHSFTECDRAKSREAVETNIQYLKL